MMNTTTRNGLALIEDIVRTGNYGEAENFAASISPEVPGACAFARACILEAGASFKKEAPPQSTNRVVAAIRALKPASLGTFCGY